MNTSMVRTKATGLGLPIAEKNKSPVPVTIWYPDDCSSPCLRYSRAVVHCVHVNTSTPNLLPKPSHISS